MTLNERANRVADELERDAAKLRIASSKVAGARILDCGGAVTGSLAAGLGLARACLADLERTGQLVRIESEVDPNLEAAEIQRRVYAAGGPALLFTRAKGTPFPMASNLFGTLDRARFLFLGQSEGLPHPARNVVG